MKIDGKCIRNLGYIGLLSAWAWLSLNASDSLERALKLESVLYSLEVQGDASSALKMIDSDPSLSGPESQNDPELQLLKIRCLLAEGELTQAKDLYRELKQSELPDSPWVHTANQLVPESFIEREVPWEDGMMYSYQIIRTNGSPTSIPIAYSFLQVSHVESEVPHESRWNIHCWQMGSSFRSFLVQLDRNSLEVKSTQIDDLPLWEIERKWLGLASQDANDPGVKVGSSWLLHGLLLQQCKFDLGYEQTLQLYSVDTGSEEQVEVTVESKALVELPDHSRRPCWIAEVNREGLDNKWESYAFSDGESKMLTQYETDAFSVTVSPESLSMIDGGNDPFVELTPNGGRGDQADRNQELRIFVGMKNALRVYLMKGPLAWAGDADEIELSEAGVLRELGERILQIREKKSGRWIGVALRQSSRDETLVAFGNGESLRPWLDDLGAFLNRIQVKEGALEP